MGICVASKRFTKVERVDRQSKNEHKNEKKTTHTRTVHAHIENFCSTLRKVQGRGAESKGRVKACVEHVFRKSAFYFAFAQPATHP